MKFSIEGKRLTLELEEGDYPPGQEDACLEACKRGMEITFARLRGWKERVASILMEDERREMEDAARDIQEKYELYGEGDLESDSLH